MGMEKLLLHSLFIVVTLVLPLLGHLNKQTLKQIQALDESMRVKVYLSSSLFQWLLLCVLLFTVHDNKQWPAQLGLALDKASLWQAILIGGSIVGVLLGIEWWCLSKPACRSYILKLIKPMLIILPYSRKERIIWVLVALTAGLIEEVLFRGFLFYYVDRLNFGGPWPLFFLLTSVSFGISHSYQGWWGISIASLAGLLLGLGYWWSGNLAISVISHVFIDLRILFWPKEIFTVSTKTMD